MKDLIKKIRAVEPTKEQTKDRTPEYAFGWVDSLNAITKVVKNNIDLAIVMHWVAVKDRLPEDGGYFNCCLENGAITNCLYTITDNRWFLRDGVEVRQHNKVVYWMKMPEPPCV